LGIEGGGVALEERGGEGGAAGAADEGAVLEVVGVAGGGFCGNDCGDDGGAGCSVGGDEEAVDAAGEEQAEDGGGEQAGHCEDGQDQEQEGAGAADRSQEGVAEEQQPGEQEREAEDAAFGYEGLVQHEKMQDAREQDHGGLRGSIRADRRGGAGGDTGTIPLRSLFNLCGM
jgi:hypothetical protein